MNENERLIKIDRVSKSYRQKNELLVALNDVSLTIEEGDVYGIIGRSGAGKSTLIRCLAHLEEPSSGEISLFGEKLGQWKGKEARSFYQSIGMIFQHFNLFSSRTCRENISYPLEVAGWGKAEREARVDELLELVDLKDQGMQYPAQLSGGQKQRVGIARAIAHHPRVLFCDEATSALDPQTTREVLDLLRSINRKLGITIVLITHEMEVIKEVCKKVAILHEGEVIEKGRVSEIFGSPKHPVTKNLVETTIHEIPAHFFEEIGPGKKVLRLRFKGKKADEPVISEMSERFNVKANILLGWIDCLETTIIGTLIIQLIGEETNVSSALTFLEENGVLFEELTNE